MAKEWMSLAHASSVLGISVKALHVRIEELGYETRVKNGKRYVAIDMAQKALTNPNAGLSAPAPTQALAKLAETRASRAIKKLTHEHARQTKLAEDAVAGWQRAAIDAEAAGRQRERDLRRARVRTTIAASVASVALVAMVLGVLWASHSLTTTDAAMQVKDNQLSATKAQTQTLEQSLGDSRESLELTRYRLNSIEDELKDAQQQSFKASLEAAAAKREAEVLREQLDKQRASFLRGRE